MSGLAVSFMPKACGAIVAQIIRRDDLCVAQIIRSWHNSQYPHKDEHHARNDKQS
jgi:hypothetical protein